jgi:pyridoxine 5-phosphate synthase
MILLGLNVDHVATLRQARGTSYPDPVAAALAAEKAGVDSITVHLREDRRHIQDRDVQVLKEVLGVRLNLETAVTDEMLDFAETLRPHSCCLVPERREELTTEGGLDVVRQFEKIRQACERLRGLGITVSLFIDPDKRQIEAAAKIGVPYIEIHTGQYAEQEDRTRRAYELSAVRSSAEQAVALGLRVNAGHGLNYQNVKAIAAIPEIEELNIGHGIVAQAIFSGLAEAVKKMKRLLREARY